MEAYVYVVCIVGDYVFLSHGLAVSAFFAGRKFFFQHLSVYGNAKGVLTAFLFSLSSQLVGYSFVLEKNIRKEELHFVYSSGNIETVSFYSVSQGLERGPSAVLRISVCVLNSLPPMYPQLPFV